METVTRINLAMSDAVAQGILIDTESGAAFAWAYMAARAIPHPVILRVLAEPGRRRPCDPVMPDRCLSDKYHKNVRRLSIPAIYRSDYTSDSFQNV